MPPVSFNVCRADEFSIRRFNDWRPYRRYPVFDKHLKCGRVKCKTHGVLTMALSE
jgi:hypothetical protein